MPHVRSIRAYCLPILLVPLVPKLVNPKALDIDYMLKVYRLVAFSYKIDWLVLL